MICQIRFAEIKDASRLIELDRQLSSFKVIHKIHENEIMVAENEGHIIGFLRYGHFWDQIPYMNMLWVIDDFRNQGVGTQLVDAWEKHMQTLGHPMILTSTMANETSQHFYRKLGYEDCGNLAIEKEGSELILKKLLHSQQNI